MGVAEDAYDDGDRDRRLRLAARAPGRAGLAHAYGHCSLRLDEHRFRVNPAVPLGCVPVGSAGTTVGIDGALPEGVLGEVRLHQQIYRTRPEVNGICRVQPPRTMTPSTLRRTPRARHGFGTYFAPCPPLWDDPMLIRDDDRASQCVAVLGSASAVVLRGNGAITVGDSLEQAVVLAWYLEDAARVEMEVLSTGCDGAELTSVEASARAIWAGGLVERMWQYLTHGDPEAGE